MKKLKIGLVLDDNLDKPDGVQQYVKIVGSWLAEQGHEVHYLVSGSSNLSTGNVYILSKNIKVKFNHNVMSTPLPTSNIKIKNLLNNLKLDVLHVQMPYSPFMAGKIIKYASKDTAVVGTFHILPFSVFESVATEALSLIVSSQNKRFDKIFSVSEPAKKFAKNRFHIDSTVLPNAINTKNYFQKNKLSVNDNKIKIVFLGRLVERKGCMELLRAVDGLDAGSRKKIKVLIAGKGPLAGDLRNFVKINKLNEVVEFLGFIDEIDKPKLLASADIAVFPSKGGESFGIVLLEAMAAGSRTILAGNNEGYKSVMNYEVDQIFDPRDTSDFSIKLKYFIENEQARKDSHSWQAEHVKQFDINIIGKKLLAEYQRILREKQNIR